MTNKPYDKYGLPKLPQNDNWLKSFKIIGSAISVSLLLIIKYSKIIFNAIKNRIQK